MGFKICYSLAVALLILTYAPSYPDCEDFLQIPKFLQASRHDSSSPAIAEEQPFYHILKEEVVNFGVLDHISFYIPQKQDPSTEKTQMLNDVWESSGVENDDSTVSSRFHHSQFLFCPKKDINSTVNYCFIGEYMCNDFLDNESDYITESSLRLYGFCPDVEFSNITLEIDYCPINHWINEYVNIEEHVQRNMIGRYQYGICQKGGGNATVDLCMVNDYYIDDQEKESIFTASNSSFDKIILTDIMINFIKDFSQYASNQLNKVWHFTCTTVMESCVDILQSALNLTVKFAVKLFSNGQHRQVYTESDSRKMTACVTKQCYMPPSELVKGVGEFSPFIDGMYKEPQVLVEPKHAGYFLHFFHYVKDQFMAFLTVYQPTIGLTVDMVKITVKFILKCSVKIISAIMNSESQARKMANGECTAWFDDTGEYTAKLIDEKTNQEDKDNVCATDTLIILTQIIAACSMVSFISIGFVIRRYRKQAMTNNAVKRKITRKDLNACPGDFDQGLELAMKYMDYPSHHEYADDIDDFDEIIAFFDSAMKINEDKITADIDNDDEFVSCVDHEEVLVPLEEDICFWSTEETVFSDNPVGLEIYSHEVIGDVQRSSRIPKIFRRVFGRTHL